MTSIVPGDHYGVTWAGQKVPLEPGSVVKYPPKQIVCHECGMSTWHGDHCHNPLCVDEETE